MPNKTIAMLIVRRLIIFSLRGLAIRAIAAELGVGVKTVVTYQKRIKSSNKTPDELLAMDDALLAAIMQPGTGQVKADPRTEAFMKNAEYYLSELAQKRASRTILFEEYSKQYPNGYKYSKFCYLLAEASAVKNAVVHNEYIPGDKLMFDFAGNKMRYIHRDTGEVIEVPVFIAVCPYSSFAYAEALEDATLPQVVKALNGCLIYLGGVPGSAKTDNMKQVVLRPCLYEPAFTEMLQQWALHNGIALFAARIRKPRDKGPVEAQVRITYDQIYARMRNEVFYSLRDLNDALRQQLEAFNNRPMQRGKYSRYQRFLDMEKPVLKPLPASPYVIKHRAQRKISFNYHFKLAEDGHQYSVPSRYIGQKLIAVYDTQTVEIYDGLTRILIYPRIHRPGYTTVAEHMPSSHQAYQQQKSMDAEYFLNAAEKIGPYTYQYMQGVLKSRDYPEQAYDGCRGILRFAQKSAIGTQRLELACKRGLRTGNYSYRTISNILQNNQDKLELPENATQPELFPVIHENLRGPDAYQ
jgi:transposase